MPTDLPDPITVVIASPLEEELVERIRAVDRERVRVVHEPSLIPTARFVADHTGVPPELDRDGIARWLSIIAEADVLFDVDWYAPRDLPRNAPNLRWVQATRSGVSEYLRRDGLDRAPFVVTNASGVHAVPLAEFVVLGLLYLVKDVPHLVDEQRRRSWDPKPTPVLAGRRVLVLGLGGLGREVARTLAALGVEVWGARRTEEAAAPEGVSRLVPTASLRGALGEVDALVIAVPNTAATHHMIGRGEIAAMKRGAHLVNIARGTVVDEQALCEALASGHLGGAALDVVEREPLDPASPLWGMRNVLLSPHRMSIVEAENPLIVELFCDNLRRFLDGQALRNVFDPERGY